MAAPYLTTAALVARRPRLGDEDPALLPGRVDQFEKIIERARGVAFVSRTATSRAYWKPNGWYRLPDIEVTAVTAVTVDLVTQVTASEIWPDRLGDFVRSIDNSWDSGLTLVTYDYGLTGPPEDAILDACAEYVESITQARMSGTSRNVISQALEGATTRYVTPDWDAGAFTGWMEVDRLINSIRDRRPKGLTG